jgi:hypothetical protein
MPATASTSAARPLAIGSALPHREDLAQGHRGRTNARGIRGRLYVLTGAQLRELEPHLSEALAGAIHFSGSLASSDSGLLTKAYADLFTDRGGRFLKGDARQLDSHPLGLEPCCRQGLDRGPRRWRAEPRPTGRSFAACSTSSTPATC